MLVENILMDLWKNFRALFLPEKKSGDRNKKERREALKTMKTF